MNVKFKKQTHVDTALNFNLYENHQILPNFDRKK